MLIKAAKAPPSPTVAKPPANLCVIIIAAVEELDSIITHHMRITIMKSPGGVRENSFTAGKEDETKDAALRQPNPSRETSGTIRLLSALSIILLAAGRTRTNECWCWRWYEWPPLRSAPFASGLAGAGGALLSPRALGLPVRRRV